MKVPKSSQKILLLRLEGGLKGNSFCRGKFSIKSCFSSTIILFHMHTCAGPRPPLPPCVLGCARLKPPLPPMLHTYYVHSPYQHVFSLQLLIECYVEKLFSIQTFRRDSMIDVVHYNLKVSTFSVEYEPFEVISFPIVGRKFYCKVELTYK